MVEDQCVTGGTNRSAVCIADDFADYSKNIVDAIRAATSSAPPPIIEERPCSFLSEMKMVKTRRDNEYRY
jgi:hypothetical protein